MSIIGRNNFHDAQDFDQALRRHGGRNPKRALCFGDSWLQYPTRPIDINKCLARKFRDTLFLNESVAGRDSAQWKLALPRIQREVGSYQFDAIILSTGGNDVVGDELYEFVKTAGQAQSLGSTPWRNVPAQVLDHIRLESFEHALRYAMNDFNEVVQYRDMYSPRSIIYVHTYDYIYPSGQPWRLGKIKAGPWVKPAFDSVGLTDPAQQRIVTNWLLDQFARELGDYASRHPNMRVVNSLGVIRSPSLWGNEIHPTEAGFDSIVRQRWIPALTGVLR